MIEGHGCYCCRMKLGTAPTIRFRPAPAMVSHKPESGMGWLYSQCSRPSMFRSLTGTHSDLACPSVPSIWSDEIAMTSGFALSHPNFQKASQIGSRKTRIFRAEFLYLSKTTKIHAKHVSESPQPTSRNASAICSHPDCTRHWTTTTTTRTWQRAVSARR